MKKIIVFASAALLVAGCGKSVDVNGKGAYINSNSGVVGIGQFEVVTNPEGSNAARLHYYEDTAWLSPTTKTHEFKANLYGTNSCESAENIVKEICRAFAPNTPTNAVESVMGSDK